MNALTPSGASAFFYINSEMEIEMPEETNPTTETVEPAAQAVGGTEVPQEEPFDKDRAMKTIQAQREENKTLKARAKRADELEAEAKKRADAELSETERLKKENDEIKAENAKTKNDLMRREAVEAAGLPTNFAKRLTGNTADELLADAQELAKTLPQLKVAPKLPPTNPSNSQPIDNEAVLRQTLFGGNSTRLDKEGLKRLGGGVVWNDK